MLDVNQNVSHANHICDAARYVIYWASPPSNGHPNDVFITRHQVDMVTFWTRTNYVVCLVNNGSGL